MSGEHLKLLRQLYGDDNEIEYHYVNAYNHFGEEFADFYASDIEDLNTSMQKANALAQKQQRLREEISSVISKSSFVRQYIDKGDLLKPEDLTESERKILVSFLEIKLNLTSVNRNLISILTKIEGVCKELYFNTIDALSSNSTDPPRTVFFAFGTFESGIVIHGDNEARTGGNEESSIIVSNSTGSIQFQNSSATEEATSSSTLVNLGGILEEFHIKGSGILNVEVISMQKRDKITYYFKVCLEMFLCQ